MAADDRQQLASQAATELRMRSLQVRCPPSSQANPHPSACSCVPVDACTHLYWQMQCRSGQFLLPLM